MSYLRKGWKRYAGMGVGYMLLMTWLMPELLTGSARSRLLSVIYLTAGYAAIMFLIDGSLTVRLLRYFERKAEEKRAVETDARERTER